MISFIRVTSFVTRISWQLMQPIAIAECTALPFVLSSWQAMQVEGSALGSRGTGCLAAKAGRANVTAANRQAKDHFVVR